MGYPRSRNTHFSFLHDDMPYTSHRNPLPTAALIGLQAQELTTGFTLFPPIWIIQILNLQTTQVHISHIQSTNTLPAQSETCCTISIISSPEAVYFIKLFYFIHKMFTFHIKDALKFNLLALESGISILAHPVCKMWIIQEPKKVAIWNKWHFEEKKKRSVCSMFKKFSMYICWKSI
jgi:hypothetical protein